MNCPFIKKNNIEKPVPKNQQLDIYCTSRDEVFSSINKNNVKDLSDMIVKSSPYRGWYEKHSLTKNHARHCLPLAMANSLGYILSAPTTFRVSWSGEESEQSKIEIFDENFNKIVTNHSAPGTFTIQYPLVPKTNKNYFTYIKGIPNIRTKFNVMEGLLESWWFEGLFGVVCLLNQPCDFIINKGDPIATILIFHKDGISFDLNVKPFDHSILCYHKIWKFWKAVKNITNPNFEKYSYAAKLFDKLKNKKKKLEKLLLKNIHHDFDYAEGRYPEEEEKPKDRQHFKCKDSQSKISSSMKKYIIDHYNSFSI